MRSTGATSKYSLRGVFSPAGYQLATNSSSSSMHCTQSTTLRPNALSRYLLFFQQEIPSCFTIEILAIQPRLFGYTPAFLIDQHFLGTCSTSPTSRWLQPTAGPPAFHLSSIQTLIIGASVPSFYLLSWRLKFLTLTSLTS